MLYTEFNLDDALAITREEGKEEIVINLLKEGSEIEFVQKISGFDKKRY